MSRRLAILDLDGTLLNGQSQQKLISFFYQEKLLSFWYYVRLNLWYMLYKLGLVKDVRSVFEYAINYLKNKDVDEIKKLIRVFFETKGKASICSGSIPLIKKLKNEDDDLIILSTAIDILVEPFAEYFEIKNFISTTLEQKNGRFTGHLSSLVYGQIKSDLIIKYCEERSYDMSDCYAFADHVSDLPLLEKVGHPFAVNPNNAMKRLAKERSIDIIYL